MVENRHPAFGVGASTAYLPGNLRHCLSAVRVRDQLLGRRQALVGIADLTLQLGQPLAETLEPGQVRPQPMGLPIQLVSAETEDDCREDDAADQHTERNPDHVEALYFPA